MIEIAIFVFILVISVILHELGHGYAAYVQGDNTAKDDGRLTLNPVPHIDPLGSLIVPGVLVAIQSSFLFGWAKPIPYNPYNLRWGVRGEAFVASAGVLVNITIALLAALLFATLEPSSEIVQAVLRTTVLLNIVLAVINLIPFPPLDGFRVLTCLLPQSARVALLGLEESFTRRLNPLAAFGLVFLILFVFLNPIIQFVFFITDFLIPMA